MKKEFETVEIEAVKMETDVITASNVDEDGWDINNLDL